MTLTHTISSIDVSGCRCALQVCCQNCSSSCCTGVVDPDELAQNATCPCQSCWEKVSTYIDKAVKTVGGIGLFFSFTEVTPFIQRCLYFVGGKHGLAGSLGFSCWHHWS